MTLVGNVRCQPERGAKNQEEDELLLAELYAHRPQPSGADAAMGPDSFHSNGVMAGLSGALIVVLSHGCLHTQRNAY